MTVVTSNVAKHKATDEITVETASLTEDEWSSEGEDTTSSSRMRGHELTSEREDQQLASEGETSQPKTQQQ